MTPALLQPTTVSSAAAVWDNRASQRQQTMFVIGRIVTPQRERICLVRNLSAAGAGVEQTGELPIASEVSIETRTILPTRAVVRWSTARAAGLEFLEPPRVMTAKPDAEGAHHVLRSPRFSFVRAVRLLVGDVAIDTETVDIALGGVKLAGVDADLPVDPARIELPGGCTLHGRLRWNNAGVAGFQFVTPISQQHLSTLLDQARDVTP
ncbi:hypothetical protein [Sphingomonas sp. RS2018]